MYALFNSVLLLVLLTAGPHRATGGSAAPERKVTGNVIVSEHDPKIRVRLPSSARYVGADRWVLYGMADCELHAFVEADEAKNVKHLYWVQFESYLPTKPDLHHTYDSPRHTTIGGLDFYVDTWAQPKGEGTEPGSDSEHIEALLHAKHYNAPAGMIYVRFVHLLDEQKRKELMIIYAEDVASSGHSAIDLRPGGKAYDHWPAIEKPLIDRAQQKIVLESPPALHERP